ncbi:MAG TPA: Shedu anti-phage system protein SduA domain-containing protein [Chthoniobacterales bacterium]
MKSIRSKWGALLRKEKLHERYYHDFIARHAHTFFPMLMHSIQVISKIRLGAELVTDLVLVRDEASMGLSYLLIEIEPPWAVPFTKDGVASARLTRAIHQILDWKRWIEEHRSEARKLFPSFLHYADPKTLFDFCIVIGTRQNSRPWLDKRNHLAETLGISIRSFDWLTGCLSARSQCSSFADEYLGGGAEEDALNPQIKNALANPFVRAMTDPEWREFISGRFSDNHMVGHHAERLLQFRRTNSHEAQFLRRHGPKKRTRIKPKLAAHSE